MDEDISSLLPSFMLEEALFIPSSAQPVKILSSIDPNSLYTDVQSLISKLKSKPKPKRAKKPRRSKKLSS